MRVICKTNTTKLVKGATYEVSRLRNTNTGQNYNSVSIKGLGTYVVKNFTQMDGTPLPKIDWVDPTIINQYNQGYIQNPENLKKGDILSCRSDSKYLTSGKMYRISDVVITERSYRSGLKYKETRIKVEGLNRLLNTYRFRLLNQEELRDISLSEIFEIPQKLSVDKSVRKIDALDIEAQRKIIMGVIFGATLDPYRNNLSIKDWAIQKTGKKWDLTIDDLYPYLNLTIEDIINLMN